MRHLFLCFMLLFVPLCAEENLVVRLPTQTELLPLYLSQITGQDTEFDKGYLSKLDAVLRYDFENNGITQVLERSSDKETLASKSYDDPRKAFDQWRRAKAMYVVVPRVEANHLNVRLISLNNEVVKEISDITLSGNLNEDRRRIHQTADSIHHELFGTEGIASTRILFTRRITNAKGTTDSEVWEADYDGNNARQVTNEGAYIVTPTYVPPATGKAPGQFMYVTYKWGQPKVMYASLKTGEGQRLSPLRGNQLLPAVSPQRDRVAFISDITGNPDLFVQGFNPDAGPIGKPHQVFAAQGAVQGSPSFSPNGTQLAFVSNKAGQPQIYVMNIPDPGARLSELKPVVISTRARNGSAPSWSPDGTKIAFTALTQGLRQIWVYDFDTRQEYQITTGPSHKENPSWAPDSLHLVYNTADQGSADLYMIDLRRLKPIKIVAGDGEKRFPAWEPRPLQR
ncbi:MAG: Tol-Pal system protein TolB [Chlamydiales bacterium]|nr:Tol-Pal system protein TolB [Chlamydiales bacterium]